MHTKIIIFLILAALSLSLSSCFEILEEVNINNDGSGSVTYTVNLSQSKLKLSQVMKLDSINGYPIPSMEQLSDSMANYFSKAKQIEGLSNHKKTEDFENFIFTFSCDFDKVETLNKLGSSVDRSKNGDPNLKQEHYSYSVNEKKYTRSGSYSVKNQFDKLKTVDQAIFANAMIISIFRGEETITEVENSKAKLSANKKASMLILPILDVIEGKSSISNTVKVNQ